MLVQKSISPADLTCIMRVLLNTEFAASRKEPLVEMLDRIVNGFLNAGLGSPTIHFSFSDCSLPGHVSSVDRVLRRFPDMQRFFDESSVMPAIPATRRLTNQRKLQEPVDVSVLRAIAAGVPKSFPFHGIAMVFAAPGLGEGSFKTAMGEMMPGISLGDSWWVSGRSRSLSAFVFLEVETASKKLPPLPDSIAKLYSALGKARRTIQMPLPGEHPQIAQAAKPETLQAVSRVVTDFRARMPQILEEINFPHDLPPVKEAMMLTSLGEKTGAKKPVLVRVFKPMGYDCNAASGTFTLRRKTAAHSTLEISLDVGTWSRSLTASFAILGLGFRALVHLQVSKRAGPGQYPIGDADRWQQIVDNLQAMVGELERTLVAEVEAAAGPTPEWYTPES